MILYSIIPPEVVFSEPAANNAARLIDMEYLGQKVQVLALDSNSFVIDRIISTSPKAFLDPRLQPGKVITSW